MGILGMGWRGEEGQNVWEVCQRRAARQGNLGAEQPYFCGFDIYFFHSGRARSPAESNSAGKNAMPYDSHSITLPSDLFSLALHPSRPLLAAGLSSGHLHTYTWPYSEGSDDDHEDDDDDDVEGNAKKEEDGGFKIAWKTMRHKGSCRCVAFSADGDGGFIPPHVAEN